MKKILVTAGVLIVVVFAAAVVFRFTTKSYSPESNTTFDKDGLKISVFYNRPSKKGRVIFGGLVPYGKTWRTGANEPTTFETNKPLTIGDKKFQVVIVDDNTDMR